MARDANRPFIDRRLGLIVLFSSVPTHMRGVNVKDVAETAVDDVDGLSGVWVTDVRVKDNPPQAKIILNTSNMSPTGINRLGDEIERVFDIDVGRVSHIEVVSLSLSPGDKVRNAIGV